MLLRVLGSVGLVGEQGQTIRLGGNKERALLASLAVHANRVVSERQLVDAVWRDDPPPSAVPTLRTYVSRLRRAIDGQSDITVETRPPGYLLRVAPGCLDAATAEGLLEEAREQRRAGHVEATVDGLARAAAMWEGPSLGEFASEPFALAEALRLDELRVVVAEERLDAALVLGRHREVLAELEGLCSTHPFRERLWAFRVTALYRSGRQGEALRAYQELRHHLVSELGIEPSAELRTLEAAVLAQDTGLDWSPTERASAGTAAPRPRAGDPSVPVAVAHNVPAALSTFVGRDDERKEVTRLLRAGRLVTLVGTPGVGKTRLSLEVAADLIGDHPDGVWLVELAPVGEPALVPQTVASVLAVRERPGVDLTDTLVAQLADRRLMLVLDNCEHLVESCGRLAERLLGACPGLVILATSREPLGLDGEWVRRLQPLGVPAVDEESYESLVAHDAVRLFVERSATTPTGLVLTARTASTVAEICRGLDGIPLAIELAAARLDVLSPAEIVEQLERRFRLLRSRARAAPSFHSSLLEALDWSHNLLSEPEAALLRRLSVFVGGCTLEAAEAVVEGQEVHREEVMELLGALVSKSLVVSDGSHGPTRYRLLDTVRHYAADKLSEAGERTAVCAAHCAWAVTLAERAESELISGKRAGWLERLDAEQDNFRAANEWATTEGRTEVPLRLGASLAMFWWLQGHVREGRHLLERALTAGTDDAPARQAKAMWGAAFLIGSSGGVSEALPLVQRSLALAEQCNEESIRGRARNLLGLLSMYRSPGAAVPILAENVERARNQSDAGLLTSSLCTLGTALLLVGDAAAARVRLDESLTMARRSGNRSVTATVLGLLGQAALAEGDYPRAEALLEDALEMAHALSERGEVAVVLTCLAELARSRGDYAEARAHLGEAMALAHVVGRPFLVARCLCLLGRVALCEGDAAEARSRFTESLATARELGLTYLSARCLLGLGEISTLEGDTTAARGGIEEALTIARTADDRQAVATATLALADLARRDGAPGRARSLGREALEVQHQIGDLAGIASSLETLAALDGPSAEATRLFGAAQVLRDGRGYARPPAWSSVCDRHLALARKALGEAGFAIAWSEGRALSVVEAVISASRTLGPA